MPTQNPKPKQTSSSNSTSNSTSGTSNTTSISTSTSNLVQTWLTAIGLSKTIVQTFEAAGIVHPRDLAELDVCHYPALGVKEAGDRKKLFYLIQRVKMAVPDDDDDDDDDGGGYDGYDGHDGYNEEEGASARAGRARARARTGREEQVDDHPDRMMMDHPHHHPHNRHHHADTPETDHTMNMASLETSTSHSSWQHAGEKTGDGEEPDEELEVVKILGERERDRDRGRDRERDRDRDRDRERMVGAATSAGGRSSMPDLNLENLQHPSENAVVGFTSDEEHYNDDDDDDESVYEDTYDHEEEDDDDDDGIDEALEEQYKPLLSNSYDDRLLYDDEDDDDGDDEDNYHTGDEYTSSEAVPSPPSTPLQHQRRKIPPTSGGSGSGSGRRRGGVSHFAPASGEHHDDNFIDHMDVNIHSMDMGDDSEDDDDANADLMMNFDMGALDADSPLRVKREEEFLKRRNERLKQLTPTRKSKTKPPAPEKKQTKKKKKGGIGGVGIAGTGTGIAGAASSANKRMTRSKAAAAAATASASSSASVGSGTDSVPKRRTSLKERVGGMFRSPGSKEKGGGGGGGGGSVTSQKSQSRKERVSQSPLRRILGKAAGTRNMSGSGSKTQENPTSQSRYGKVTTEGATVKVRVRSKSANLSRHSRNHSSSHTSSGNDSVSSSANANANTNAHASTSTSTNLPSVSSPSNKTRRQTMAKLQKTKLQSRTRSYGYGDGMGMGGKSVGGTSTRVRTRKMDMEPILVPKDDSEQEHHHHVVETDPDSDAVPNLDLFLRDRDEGDDADRDRRESTMDSELDDYDGDQEEENGQMVVNTGPGSPTARRVSKRLQEKKMRNMFSSSATGTVTTAASTTNTNSGKSISSSNKGASPRNKYGFTVGANAATGDDSGSLSSRKSASSRSLKASSSSARRIAATLDDSEDDNEHPISISTTSIPNIPTSKPVRQTSARDRRSKLQNFMGRESKRLSTIPSGISAPMSPPLMSSVADLDGDLEIQNYDDAASLSSARSANSSSSRKSSSRSRSSKLSHKSRRQTLSIEEKNSKSNSSDLGRAKSTPRYRSAAAGGLEAVPLSQIKSTSDLEVNLKAKSFEEKEKIRDSRDGDTGRGNRNVSTKATNQSSGAVFVHGGKPDKSWASQVNYLREQNAMRHEKETGGDDNRRDYEDEMRIRVIVRKRPMSKKEASKKGEVDVIHPLRYSDYGRILVYQPKTRVDLTKEVEALRYAFDNVFTEVANNCEIYNETIKPLIPGAFEGRWASVFAYGQTGSGKTFTMMGSTLTGIKAKTRNVEHEKNYGLYLLAARDLFEFANRPEYSHLSVGASLFEIYGGKLFDLLNNRAPVKCLENHKGRVCFPGLSEHPIGDANELMLLIEAGSSNRSTGSTSANRDSSRSHAVLQLHLRKSVGKKQNVEHGRLTFIDLAGSERGADTNKACRTTRQEGADINVSLLALKEVIRALATGDSMTHIPFRGSKLTQVLKEGFVGKNSRTVMVACIAPNMTNCEHTLNTLRYADRVKERNADSGQLTADVARASKIQTKPSRPLSAPSASNDIDRGDIGMKISTTNIDTNIQSDEDDIDDDNWLSDLDKDDEDDLPFDPFNEDDEGMDELNEVLKSPVATKLDSTNFFGDDDNKATSTKQKVTKNSPLSNSPSRSVSRFKTKKEAVAPLVGAHRSIMTEMLSMVKQEMTLVNCTDGDRELIDEYLDELEQIQDKQLSMISTLRESLVQYYAQRPNGNESLNRNGNRKNDKTNQSSILADDSFDDLRSPF